MVGMGMPRQELWIAQNRAALAPCAMLPVGGAFDYEAGVQARGPPLDGPHRHGMGLPPGP